MVRKKSWLIVLFTLAVAPTAAKEGRGEDLPGWPAVRVGDRVRVRTSTDRVTGSVLGLDEAGLLIQTGAGPGPVRIPLETVERLAVAVGKKGHAKEGAAIGFIPGALALGYVMAAFTCMDEPSDCRGTQGWITGAALGGSVTAGIGALIGLAIRTERWRPVAAGARSRRPTLSMRFAPAPRGD